jgi:hypothetical protein
MNDDQTEPKLPIRDAVTTATVTVPAPIVSESMLRRNLRRVLEPRLAARAAARLRNQNLGVIQDDAGARARAEAKRARKKHTISYHDRPAGKYDPDPDARVMVMACTCGQEASLSAVAGARSTLEGMAREHLRENGVVTP